MDDAFERLLRKTEEEARAARRGGVQPAGSAPAEPADGATQARPPSPVLRALGQALPAPPSAAGHAAPGHAAGVSRAAVRRPVAGPPSGNAALVDASDEFGVYERPAQPGEAPKSRGLRAVEALVHPMGRDLVPPELPADPPRPGQDAPVVVGIPEQPATMFTIAPEPQGWTHDAARGIPRVAHPDLDAAGSAADAPARAVPAQTPSTSLRQSVPHFPDAPAAAAGDAPRIAIVQSDYNLDVTNSMEEWARRHAEGLGAPIVQHVHVPGVFDAPLMAKRMAQREDVDAVVVLGCVIQGETGHDLVITQACADQLARLACELDKPIAFGVLGPRMTRAQAEARVAMGKHAVESVVLQWRALRVA